MVCDQVSELKKQEGWLFKVQVKFKSMLSGGTEVGRTSAQEVDRILERFKALRLAGCRWWNACMPMDLWKEFMQQYSAFLKLGNQLTEPSRGTIRLEDLKRFLHEAQALERFYDQGIPETYKR